MNAKEAKGLRQSMRQAGLDPKDKTYRQQARITEDGDKLPGTITLSPGCGRYQYKQLKQGTLT